jgi:protein-disulfide isomerase
VAVIAIFIVSGGAIPIPMTTLPSRAARDIRTLVSKPVPLLIALLLLAGATSVVAFFPRDGAAGTVPVEAVQLPAVTDAERAKLAEWWEMQPKVNVPVPDGGAKVLVVKFNDYQCPLCKLTHDMYKPVWAKHAAGGQVRYIVKHYPLEGECNPSAAGANHYASCEAAAGVIMARSKGTAARLEDWIFANIGPPILTPAQVRDAARSVGGITDFDAQYARALEEVKTDAGLGQLLGVNATPTFFINGRKLPTTLQAQYFDAIIELELQRAK